MKKIIKNKYILLIPILILNIISLIYLYNTKYFLKQFIFLTISYIALFLSSKINYKFILKYLKYLYIFSIFLLLLVLIIGREINGAKAWLQFFGFSIQPSEITKLILVIYFAYLIENNNNFLKLIILTLIPSFLTFLEPDTGAIIIYLIILFSCLKYSKVNKKSFIIITIIILLFLIANVSLYFINKDLLINIYGTKIFYRIDRLITFKNQDNIQNIYSLISIGSNKLLYIPENHNDFIFASIISKYNFFIFIIIIICIFLIISYYIRYSNKNKNISNITNFIILNMLIFQIFYNILMNLSLLPIIGIPFPFLSYGGSYLLTLYILIGFSINFNNMDMDK